MPTNPTVLTLGKLDLASCQNLLHYASSRARAIALAFVTNHRAFSEGEREEYLGCFTNELLVGVYILGYAVVVHGDEITVPWALRKFGRALTQERLADVTVLLETAGDHGWQTDELLEFYAGDWWTRFKSSSPHPTASVDKLIEFWTTQSRNLITLGRRNVLDLANLPAMTREELVRARQVADDTLCQLDLESEKVIQQIRDVRKNIIETTTVSESLKALVDRFTCERQEETVASDGDA